MTYLEATRKTPAIADDLPPEVQRRVRAEVRGTRLERNRRLGRQQCG